MIVAEKRQHLKEQVVEKEQIYATLQKKLTDEARVVLRKKLVEEVENAYKDWQKALEAYNTFHTKAQGQGWTEDTTIVN